MKERKLTQCNGVDYIIDDKCVTWYEPNWDTNGSIESHQRLTMGVKQLYAIVEAMGGYEKVKKLAKVDEKVDDLPPW